ncbi:MAG: TIGR00645 family protein [Proteobacteria bacterium]|nr:TIGR00645 family protein [Pseudomonadota bacterium]
MKPAVPKASKMAERAIERIIMGSRWILVVFYLGLTVALALYGISFLYKLWDLLLKVNEIGETDAILKILSLIDASLVASLVVMVIISGYENFVSRFDEADAQNAELSWLGKLDASSLKIKVASTIVAISSIHLLQVFLNSNQYDNIKIMWLTVVHMAFVVSALLLAYIDKIMAGTKKNKDI